MNPHIGREMWPSPSAAMFTDASMGDWGAVWNGKVPASGFFDATQEGSSIDELELWTAIHGLRKVVQFARSRELVLVSDSRVTVHIARDWTSRSSRLLGHLRTLHALCETRRDPVYAASAFRSERLGKSPITVPRQHIVGAAAHLTAPATAAVRCAAPRRQRPSTSSHWGA
jgi:ribonuclease HI